MIKIFGFNFQRKTLSLSFLTLSVLVFSVAIPICQNQISEIKESREVYFKNLLNAEFQRLIGELASTSWRVLDVLVKSDNIAKTEFVRPLKEAQTIYLNQAQEAVARAVFLQTETLNDTPPDINRYNEIKDKVSQSLPELQQEGDTYLNEFNTKYKKGLDFWEAIQNWAFIVAIIFQILGVWLSLYVTDDSIDVLLKEVRALRGQVDRIPKK